MNDSFEQLKQDIISAAGLTSQEATGFYSLHCPICQKMERKTGGFKLEHDHIAYNCFRGSCDASCGMELGKPIPRKFRQLMDAIQVRIPVDLRMVKSSIQKAIESELDETLYKKHFFNEIQLYPGWVPLEEAPTKNLDYWLDYYESRAVPIDDIFYIEGGIYKGLTAVGVYHYDKFVGAQVVNPRGKVKYITETTNTHLVYFPERYPPDPVIVVEGLLDAKCFPNTCGLFRSKITPEQAYLLRGRDVIMLPDRKGNNFISQVKDYNWKMCIPPWKEKDLNSAVQKYGVMVVAEMIKENTFSNYLEMKVRYDLWHTKQLK